MGMETRNNLSNLKKQHILFIVLLLFAVTLSIWKCFLGMEGRDESFCLTVPHRIILGDIFFKNEWHVSQMSGFLLLPFVWLYRTIVGSNEGIILVARLYYVVCHSCISVFLYFRLKKHGYFSIFFAIIFLLYTPNTIPTYNYYTLSFDLVVLMGIIIGTSNLNHRFPLFISGLFFANAVLCSPFFILAYPIYAISVLVCRIKKQNQSDNTLSIVAPKTFLWFTLGSFSVALVFFGFVFSRASLNDVIYSIPYILSDPEHSGMSVITKIIHIAGIFLAFSPFYIVGVVLFLALLIIIRIDKERFKNRRIYLSIAALITVFIYISQIPNLFNSHADTMMIPLAMLGAVSYVFSQTKDKQLFIGMYILGFLFAFFNGFGSNVRYLVVPMGIAVSSLSSILLLGKLLNEIKIEAHEKTKSNILKRLCIPIVVTSLLLLGIMRISEKTIHCPTDSHTLAGLSYKITSGPEKGIYVEHDKYTWYNSNYIDLQILKKESPKNVLILGHSIDYLVMDNFPYATFSAWLPQDDNITNNNLSAYYKLNSTKKPFYVVISKNSKYFDDSRYITILKNKDRRILKAKQ